MRNSQIYDLVSIRRRNGGMFHRESLPGEMILTKTLREVVPGTFVIARMQIVHGASALVTSDFAGCAISKSYSSFEGTSRCDAAYFSWLAKLPFMYAYFLDSSHGVVIEKMTFDQQRWMSFPIYLPPLPEQLRIAEILATVDDAIRHTEQLIAKLNRMQQGLLHDLLTRGINENGELRDPQRHPEQFKASAIGPIPREWRVGRFGDVARGVRGVTYQPGQLQRGLLADSVILLRANNIQGGEIAAADIQIVPNRLVSEEQRVSKDDVVVCMSNGSRRLVGKSAQCITMPATPLTVGAFCSVFHPQEVVPTFLFQLFQSQLYQRQVDLALAGSAINNLRNRDIENFNCPRPPMEEQERVATTLSTISRRTELEERGLCKLRLVKQGLMDDLLTGRVRVTPLRACAAS